MLEDNFSRGYCLQESIYPNPIRRMIVAKPHHVDSGQCPKVKPMVGVLKFHSPSEWGD